MTNELTIGTTSSTACHRRGFVAVLIAGLLTTVLPATAGAPLRISFRNESSLTVRGIELRISGAKVWGSNQLPPQGLAPSARTQLVLADGADKCVAELMFTASDGGTRQLQVNFCGGQVFTFHGQP